MLLEHDQIDEMLQRATFLVLLNSPHMYVLAQPLGTYCIRSSNCVLPIPDPIYGNLHEPPIFWNTTNILDM